MWGSPSPTDLGRLLSLLSNYIVTVLLSATWEHVGFDKFLVSAVKWNALFSVPVKYTFHLSSSLTSTFSFSFGSAALQSPSLPCHFAFSCDFWLITVTQHPKACRKKSVSSSPHPCPSPPHFRSLISHLKGNLSTKALSLVCYLSECFHSLAVFHYGWWMIPTFHSQHIGFGWDGVNFFHSSPHSAVHYIDNWKGVNNTAVFCLSSACTASRLAIQHSPPHPADLWWATSWEGA